MSAFKNRFLLATLCTLSALIIAWVWTTALTTYAEYFLTAALLRFLC